MHVNIASIDPDICTLYLCAFPCKLNSTRLKNGPAPSSESPLFDSTVPCDQAIGSNMHNASAFYVTLSQTETNNLLQISKFIK